MDDDDDANRDAVLRARLDEIRLGYIDILRRHGAELQALLDRRAAGETEVDAEILALVHKVAGTSGSFGLAHVAVPLTEVEQRLLARDGTDLMGELEGLVTILMTAGIKP